jgi:hypothetical protein
MRFRFDYIDIIFVAKPKEIEARRNHGAQVAA